MAASETDIVGALVSRILTLTPVTALASTRISPVLKATGMPTYAVVVKGPVGGPGELGLGQTAERFDLWCYGPDERTSKVLADRLVFNLLKLDRSGAVAFTAAGTRVSTIRQEAGRIALLDPDTKWPYCVVPIVATYSGVPV